MNKNELIEELKTKNTAFTDESIELIRKIVLFDIENKPKTTRSKKKVEENTVDNSPTE